MIQYQKTKQTNVQTLNRFSVIVKNDVIFGKYSSHVTMIDDIINAKPNI